MTIKWVLLEARHLNSFMNSFNEFNNYGIWSIIDDKIINS